jgi:ribosomal protein L14
MSELSKSNGEKIKVQPNRKRKSGNGTHQAVCTVALVPLAIPKNKAKRGHNLAVAVRENTPMAKKSGSHTMK